MDKLSQNDLIFETSSSKYIVIRRALFCLCIAAILILIQEASGDKNFNPLFIILSMVMVFGLSIFFELYQIKIYKTAIQIVYPLNFFKKERLISISDIKSVEFFSKSPLNPFSGADLIVFHLINKKRIKLVKTSFTPSECNDIYEFFKEKNIRVVITEDF